jgi:glyoxylase-like metal-dependent hydrolase (beta-lactamase superfamily II)
VKRFVLLLLVLLLIGWTYQERRVLFAYLFVLQGEGTPPELRTYPPDPGITWLDDYYTVDRIGPGTYAISEPRYHQLNFNYLITGTKRAIVFDAGPGVRNIRPIVERLTDLPITFIPSHFHYDHVGGQVSFENIAVVNLPFLRERAHDDLLRPTWSEHLGDSEGFARPEWRVSTWLDIGSDIDLGGRRLTVLYTPGHTTDSISLWDAGNSLLFSGDYLYPGHLYGFLPNSSMGHYLWSSEYLLGVIEEHTTVLGAHGLKPLNTPRQSVDALRELKWGLEAVRDGEAEATGTYPVNYQLDEDLVMIAEPRWLQSWDPPGR